MKLFAIWISTLMGIQAHSTTVLFSGNVIQELHETSVSKALNLTNASCTYLINVDFTDTFITVEGSTITKCGKGAHDSHWGSSVGLISVVLSIGANGELTDERGRFWGTYINHWVRLRSPSGGQVLIGNSSELKVMEIEAALLFHNDDLFGLEHQASFTGVLSAKLSPMSASLLNCKFMQKRNRSFCK